MPAVSLSMKAKEAGLELVTDGDRVLAKSGAKIIAWHTSAERALNKALERLEEDRLRKLPYDSDVVIRPRAVANGRPGPPLPVAAPPVRVLRPAAPLPLPDIQPSEDTELLRQIKGSIIKTKYKERYKKQGGNCGDLIAGELAEYLVVLVAGKSQMDMKRVREVADANGIWKDSYRHLNPGQLRMTIGNRLRIRYAQGDEVNIGGVKLQMEPVA